MRRLWTLQEAQLADRLHIQFSDGPLDLDDAARRLIDCDRALILNEKLLSRIHRLTLKIDLK